VKAIVVDDETSLAPQRAAADEAGSFDELYRREQPELVRLAVLLVGSPEVAADLVQDCFVRLHPKWDQIEDHRAYLRRSVVNACHSHHRGLRRFRRLDLRPSEPVELGARELSDALGALPHRQRAALVLRFYAGLPDVDIAHALGCRPGTVASLIHRGLAALREVIEP
jgi:RNA polymerase sigma factor (sigma-70 family)